MNSALAELLFSTLSEQDSQFAEPKNVSLLKVKHEISDEVSVEEDNASLDNEQLLNKITDILNDSSSSSSMPQLKSVKQEETQVMAVKAEHNNSTLLFGEPRIFFDDRTTWELKPNQMYNPKRDNGTIRGRHLICENATYRNNGTKNSIVYWKCCFANCKARLSTSVNGEAILKYPGRHSHRLDGLDAQVLDAKLQLRLATTSEELKQAVENIHAKYPKYVQNKIKTSHISRSNRRRKQKLFKFTFDFDKFKADSQQQAKPKLPSLMPQI